MRPIAFEYLRNYWLQKPWLLKMSKKSTFRTPFGSKRVNVSQSLLKSPRQCFHSIVSYPPQVWKKSMFSWVSRRNQRTREESEGIIKDFGKKKLGIEEDILIERAHCIGKIQRNGRRRNRKRTIVLKLFDFKNKPRILHTYREKKLWKEKHFVNKGFLEETESICTGLLHKVKDLRSQNKLAKVVHDQISCLWKRERKWCEAQDHP